MLDSLQFGDVLVIASRGAAASKLSDKAKEVLKAMGASHIDRMKDNCGYTFAGIKGQTNGKDDAANEADKTVDCQYVLRNNLEIISTRSS